MADKALYVLAGFDDESEKRLSDLQNKLYKCGFTGTQTKNIPMHITLGSFPTDKEAELTEQLERLAKETESFEIVFSHVGLFAGSKIMFIAPNTGEKLLALKKNFGESPAWTSHTTMLIDEPEVIAEALPVIMKEFASFGGRVTTLHLYEFFPTRHILTVHFER